MTGTTPATRVTELTTDWMRDHLHEALAIYGAAMGYGESVVAGRYGYAVQHTERPGFRAVGGFAETPQGERLVGFGYGYLVAPGQWWHTRMPGPGETRTARPCSTLLTPGPGSATSSPPATPPPRRSTCTVSRDGRVQLSPPQPLPRSSPAGPAPAPRPWRSPSDRCR